MSDRITLRGMQFMGRHGVSDEERAEPQPFEVDLVAAPRPVQAGNDR